MNRSIITTVIIVLCSMILACGNSASDDTMENDQKEANNSIIIVEENNTEDAEPRLVENETYYFDDANYTVNGLEVHVDSITLERGHGTDGYAIYINYKVKNQNSTDATFKFSTLKENYFEFDGAKTTLAATAEWSKGHDIACSLKPLEESEQLIGDFYATSMSSSKEGDGITYGPIDIRNLYTGDTINIYLSMRGFIGDSMEKMLVSFEIEL